MNVIIPILCGVGLMVLAVALVFACLVFAEEFDEEVTHIEPDAMARDLPTQCNVTTEPIKTELDDRELVLWRQNKHD
ncbi:MAG: hypothetical protein KGL39_55485 [Patescibacteria group bacterium]|nr:hypothetical protein [Patescibacteria group bacterium]